MQAPQRSIDWGIGKAQELQRCTGWAKAVIQVSHTGRAGQALQMAHWLGSQDPNRSAAKPGGGACKGAAENLEKRLASMNSIYCQLFSFHSLPFLQTRFVNTSPPHHGFNSRAALESPRVEFCRGRGRIALVA